MKGEKVKKTFKVIGMKGEGAFTDFMTEVPKLAKLFLERLHEVEIIPGTEIALYEPKKDTDHLEGTFFVGTIVGESLSHIPDGVEFIEVEEEYVTAKGQHIGELHKNLLIWMDEQGYKRKLEAYIVETYHPQENGEEEVMVHLPIQP
ncbi:AraC family transcriptional regulator [Rossellomorea arthrocnemi]|uniref:AraC family transcriptional regulator n=1 Tax=Rossellomorea arthrocnemi TaxID=2769542 RepID=UPI001918711B|nr:AraC family transcriptional regulator [Rossellomorea arthrocnemi]